MTELGFEQLVTAMVSMGTERANAERLARRRLGIVIHAEAPAPTRAIAFPVRLTIPWSALVSDNEMLTVGGGERPRIVHKAPFREAKRRIAAIARVAIGDATHSTEPLAIVARVYVPDNRAHDIGNFRKLCTDALQGTVYANDKQLWREVWERGGVDCDAPRAEITITRLSE